MRIMALGDIFGRPGRNMVTEHIKALKDEYQVDFIVINCENASGGNGLSEKNGKELLDLSAVDIYTSGNHIWDKKEINNLLQETDRIIRPYNYPEPCPGNGYMIIRKLGRRIAVVNLSGTVYMNALNNPFLVFDELYEDQLKDCDLIIVDFHAEATSEKIAFGYYVQDRASLVFGTHTHVQTADERILQNRCGYITDIGMTGPYDGVLGVDREIIIKQFRTMRNQRFEPAKGATQINGIIAEFNDTNACISIERIRKIFE